MTGKHGVALGGCSQSAEGRPGIACWRAIINFAFCVLVCLLCVFWSMNTYLFHIIQLSVSSRGKEKIGEDFCLLVFFKCEAETLFSGFIQRGLWGWTWLSGYLLFATLAEGPGLILNPCSDSKPPVTSVPVVLPLSSGLPKTYSWCIHEQTVTDIK